MVGHNRKYTAGKQAPPPFCMT